MARNQGRMALYEAIRKSQKKIAGNGSAQLVPKSRVPKERKKVKRPEKRPAKPVQANVTTTQKWPPKNKPEVSSFKLAKLVTLRNIIIAAVIALVAFGALKIGKKFTQASLPFSGDRVSERPVETKTDTGGSTEPLETVETTGTETETVSPDEPLEEEVLLAPVGSNVIVIATYGTERDLKPVQEYFDDNGIGTEILQRLPYYFLITKNRYDNPNRRGTDGWEVKQKIKEIGAGYKAPKGFEPFGSKPFQDAYGMKLQ